MPVSLYSCLIDNNINQLFLILQYCIIIILCRNISYMSCCGISTKCWSLLMSIPSLPKKPDVLCTFSMLGSSENILYLICLILIKIIITKTSSNVINIEKNRHKKEGTETESKNFPCFG